MAVEKDMPILVVDDYKTMLRIISNLLSQLNFANVHVAPDGIAALAKLRNHEFGLVISDWNMEPMTGLQLLREVRADDMLKETPSSWSRRRARPRTSSPPRTRACRITSSSHSTPRR